MIEIGHFQSLRATRRAPPGVYLSDGESEVLLPNRYVTERMSLGDSLDVFVYTDSEDRPVATTQTPHVVVGGIACLTVVDVGPHGAFLDWGLDKDLFAPTSLQRLPMRKGERQVVAACLDERTNRVIATSRVERHTALAPDDYAPEQSVALLVYHRSQLGAHVVVDGRYEGLVHSSTVIGNAPRIGDELTGFVQRVRDDGKLDVSLKPPGRAAQVGDAQLLLAALDAAGGSLPLHDKSPPEQIAAVLSMSKKAFKKALGSLYRARLVSISERGVRKLAAKAAAKAGSDREK